MYADDDGSPCSCGNRAKVGPCQPCATLESKLDGATATIELLQDQLRFDQGRAATLEGKLREAEAKAEKWALAEAAAIDANIRLGADALSEKQRADAAEAEVARLRARRFVVMVIDRRTDKRRPAHKGGGEIWTGTEREAHVFAGELCRSAASRGFRHESYQVVPITPEPDEGEKR